MKVALFRFLVSMAPLSYEISSIDGETPPHFGPTTPEVNSIWYKMFIYNITGSGPASLLLPKGMLRIFAELAPWVVKDSQDFWASFTALLASPYFQIPLIL